jgi:rhodanese-related sulfurtransferase
MTTTTHTGPARTTAAGSAVTRHPAAPAEQAHRYFLDKLSFETDPADVARSIAEGTADFVLVDCRTVENYNKTHLPGAISLPWATIDAEAVAALPEGLLVTYCWGPSCNASTKGAERLTALGRQVKELIGGLEYWIREGHPTEGRRPVARGAGTPASWGLVS